MSRWGFSRRRLADRFYYGWVIAVSCLLVALVVFGTTYSFSVFFDQMLGSFDASRVRLSLVFGIQTVVLYVGATVAGRVVDRYGPRRMLLLGGALLVSGLLATSRVHTFAGLVVAYGLVAALGLAILYVIGYATVPVWFGRRRGVANGLATSGLGVGLVVVPAGAAALTSWLGWRTAFVALACGLAVVLLASVAVFADRPADVGADASVEFPGRAQVRSDGEGDVREGRVGSPTANVRSTILSPSFLLVLLGWCCVYATLYAVLSHAVPYATSLGLSRSVGVAVIALVGLSTSVARIGFGLLSDRVGRVRLFVACSTVMGASLVLLSGANRSLTLFGLAVVFGAGYGGNGALLSPLVADLFGNDDLNTLYGTMSLSFAVAGLCTPPLLDVAFARFGTYRPALLVVGLVGVVGAVAVALGGRLADG